MPRRTSAGRRGKTSYAKRGNDEAATPGRAAKRGGRGKRSLISRLKFW
ncbi:MAG TPA: hypothetical protein VE714_02730 [Gemmatimonadales bacterium]|jgi:hypothetical protein|nr:hypothetical protein [Gemmatimonadales bacterium]